MSHPEIINLISDDDVVGGNTIPPPPFTEEDFKETKNDYNGEARNWIFTLNNPKPKFYQNAKFFEETDKINFYFYSIEKGEKGTIHAQGFLQLEKKQKLNWLKKHLNSRCHFQIMRSTYEDNINYCSKTDTHIEGPYTKGTFQRQGQRNDLTNFVEQIKKNGKISYDMKMSSTYVQYYRGLDKIEKIAITETKKQIELKNYENCELNPFQLTWKHLIENQNDREILWIYDPEGNAGKTFFCDYMVAKHNAFKCENNAKRDVMQSYNEQKIVLIDLGRTEETTYNYNMIEKFKDGNIFKQKYESEILHIKGIKLGVFSNNLPDINALSLDRWRLLEIKENQMIKIPIIHKPKRKNYTVDPSCFE
jgi:hypothetical protein